MVETRLWLVVFLACSVALLGCPEDTDDPAAPTDTASSDPDTAAPTDSGVAGDEGGPPPAGIPIAEVSDKMSTAICDRVVACFEDFTALFEITGCAQALGQVFSDGAQPQWEAAIAGGTAAYHGDKMQTCLDALEAAACADMGTLPAECGTALEGLVEAGGTCTWDFECVGDARCDKDQACPGTCKAPVGSGEACGVDADCQGGLLCHATKCTAPGATGAACGADNPGCEFGLTCVGADDAAGTAGACAAFGDLQTQDDGEACSILTGELCKPDLHCLIQSVEADGTWTSTCGPAADSGGACRPGLPDPCPGGEICLAAAGEVDGTCTKLPAAGEACLQGGTADDGSPVQFCGQLLACNAEGKCEAMGRIGDACTDPGTCVTATCTDGKCAPANACP